MKKYILFTSIVSAIALASCESILEFESTDQILTENAIETSGDFLKARNGVYDALQSEHFLGGKYIVYADYMTDDAYILPSKHNSISTGATLGIEDDITNSYKLPYLAIDRANNCMQILDDNLFPESDEYKTIYYGEMLAIRAISHFELLRLFAQPYKIGGDNSGPGVVLQTQVTAVGENASFQDLQKVRSSIEECYAQIIIDLETAVDLLKVSGLQNSARHFVDEWVARAYLARVYFAKGDYTNAHDMAKTVINGPFSHQTNGNLVSAHAGNATSGSNPATEIIFKIDNVADDSQNGISWAYNAARRRSDTLALSNNVTFEVSPELFALFDTANDQRFHQLMEFHLNDSDRVHTLKWTFCNDQEYSGMDWDDYCSDPADFTQMRLSEMYLIAGESDLNTGGDGADEFNAIRSRAGIDSIPAPTLQDFEDERRRELCFEGDRLHNLRRLQKDIRPGVAFNDPDFILALPDIEVGANPNIQPN